MSLCVSIVYSAGCFSPHPLQFLAHTCMNVLAITDWWGDGGWLENFNISPNLLTHKELFSFANKKIQNMTYNKVVLAVHHYANCEKEEKPLQCSPKALHLWSAEGKLWAYCANKIFVYFRQYVIGPLWGLSFCSYDIDISCAICPKFYILM